MLPYINVPFDYVSNALGASRDELKLIFLFLISYPLAGVLKRVPDEKPWMKNAFTVSVSVFFLIGLFDLWSGLLLVIFDAVGTYLIASKIQGPYMPWVGFVFLMGHMSISHIYRQQAGAPSAVDITGAQMVLVMKLSGFCWNVWDGKQNLSELTDYQRDRALTSMPSPLDFAGFVMFFPSFMAGPAFDYADYRRWLETSMFELPPGTDPSKAPPTRKKRKIPRSGTPAMWKMATGLAWILAFLQFSGWYNTTLMLSSRYKSYGFLRKVFVLHMLGVTQRFKYYGVWTLTEGSCILAGIGYKGVDPKTGVPNWDRLTNIKPLGVEFAQNSHAYLGNWNINTNNWLKNYVYLRVTPKGKKPGFRATLATFFTSAFWHGFYPGYYLAFILASFLQNSAKNSRRLLRPFFMTPDGTKGTSYKIYYDIFSYLVTQLAFSFTVSAFILLTFHDCMLVWARVYFYGVLGAAICSLALLTPGKKWLQRKVKARQSRPKMERQPSQENHPHATLGVPDDPGKEWDDMVDEVVEEVKRRRGSKSGGPDGPELRRAVEEKLNSLVKHE